MANNFDGIYNGGSVTFNSMPYVQMYQQIKARNDAKQTAIDNYYRDLSKTLTPAGMAANDVEDFNGKVNQWRDYVTQNRQVLSNPRDPNYGKALNQAGYLYNDALGHADMSKRKVADADRFNQLRLSHPEYAITDNGMMAFDKSMQPISNGGGNLDWGSVEYDPKEAKQTTAQDLIKYETFVKNGLQMSEGQPNIIVDPKTKSKVVTTKSFYEPEAINLMARRSEMLYQSDPKFKSIVDGMAQDPNNYASLNQSFKKVYGHDLDIKHPEEFATALLLGQTEKTNTQPYNFSPTTIKINVPKDNDQIAPSLDNYISQLRQSSLARNFIHNGKNEVHYEIPASKEISEAFAAHVGSQTLYPDQVQFTHDGSFMPVFYKYTKDASGNSVPVLKNGKAVVDETLTHPVSMQEGRIRIAKELFGETGVKKAMLNPSSTSLLGGSSNTKKSSSKVYTLINPNTGEVVGTVDSEEEANKAAKKGYKVN